MTRLYGEAVNYKGSDGAWHPIDNQLVASPLGGYENTANGFSLRLPEALSSGVSLGSAAGAVSFSLLGASDSLPAVSGDTASYREVLSSTDVAYVSQSSGVRELVSLKDAGAPGQLRYSLSLASGLTPRAAADGSIAIVDGNGATVFVLPAPVAYSAAAGAASGRALSASLAASGSGWTITVDTSEAWLREALAVGPVVIDPSVTTYSGSQACSLSKEAPKTSKCASSELSVGYDGTHQENHGLLEFNFSGLPVGANIMSAKLGLYVQAHSTATAKAVGVYRVTKPWTTGATWETYDGTHAWGTAGGDYSNPETGSDASVNSSIGAATGWYYWYPTKLMQEWANTSYAPAGEGQSDEGLIVKDQTDNATANLLTISSPSASSNKPFLEVSYEPSGLGSEPQYTILSTQLTDKSTMGVNVANGNLSLQSQQLQINGVAGFGYGDSRVWNGLDIEPGGYSRWGDSNDPGFAEYADGSVAMEDATGAWFSFQKQANGSFIRPPGVKATMCAAGSPSPCPGSLPAGVTHQLIYDQSQDRVNFNSSKEGFQQEDRYGHKVTLEWTGEHSLVYTDPQGHKIEQIIGMNGITELKDISGSRKLSFTYKNFGEVESELETATEADGKKTSYEYSNYTITKITDPDGNVTKLTYDANRRITEIKRTTNAGHTEGPTTTFTYYGLESAPSPCTSKQYGTIVKDADWSKEKEHETLYCSNALDQVEKVVNATKHETKATFDPFGNEISATAAARETGGSAGVTSLVYGTAGASLMCETQGTTGTPETTCPTGALSKGYSTGFEYKDTNFAFQPTQETSTRRQATNLCYWGGAHECTGTSAEGATGGTGGLERQTDALSSQNSLNYSYNTTGTLNGTLNFSTDGDGHKTSYEYDEKGNLKTIIPPSGSGLAKTTITVDGIGRPHAVTQCLVESGGTCSSSQTTTLTYDADDRIIEAVDTGPGATKTFKYTFDGDGNLEKREDPAGTTKFAYDHLNRLTKEELPGGATNEYAYDPASNLTAFSDSGGVTEYIYDGLNELEAMAEPEGNCGEKPAKCTHAAYDGDGSLNKVTYPSGATLNYTIDETTGRPTSITAEKPNGETLLSHTYTYAESETTHDTPLIYKDVYSQPGTATNTTTYAYDPLDRLTEASTSGTNPSRYFYELDGAGNRTSQQINTSESKEGVRTYYKYNAGNELECRMKTNEACTKSNTTELAGYSYDGAGNQTAITGYGESGNTTFTYNNLSQLSKLTPPGGAEQALSYLGSGQSLLTSLGTIALQNSALGTTKQVNGSGSSYYARTPSGTMLDERLPSSTTYNPIYDVQGDIIGLLSTSGALVQTVRYGPFGENATTAGSVSYTPTTDPFPFQGGYHLAGGEEGSGNTPNNLYHFGSRYYDPTAGRWTQEDPRNQIADPDQANRYAFAGNDPINEGDLSGEGLISDIEEAASVGAKLFDDTPVGKTVDQLLKLKCVLEAKAASTGSAKSTIIVLAPAKQAEYVKGILKCYTS